MKTSVEEWVRSMEEYEEMVPRVRAEVEDFFRNGDRVTLIQFLLKIKAHLAAISS
jgi:hypothetical protein